MFRQLHWKHCRPANAVLISSMELNQRLLMDFRCDYFSSFGQQVNAYNLTLCLINCDILSPTFWWIFHLRRSKRKSDFLNFILKKLKAIKEKTNKKRRDKKELGWKHCELHFIFFYLIDSDVQYFSYDGSYYWISSQLLNSAIIFEFFSIQSKSIAWRRKPKSESLRVIFRMYLTIQSQRSVKLNPINSYEKKVIQFVWWNMYTYNRTPIQPHTSSFFIYTFLCWKYLLSIFFLRVFLTYIYINIYMIKLVISPSYDHSSDLFQQDDTCLNRRLQ